MGQRLRGRVGVRLGAMLVLCIALLSVWAAATPIAHPTARELPEAVPAPLPPIATVAVPPAPPAATAPVPSLVGEDFTLYLPKDTARRGPLRVLVMVHGMGSNGPTFCENFLARANADGWAVLAPTFRYQNYLDPALVREDDARVLPRLRQQIDELPERTGLTFQPKVLLYGFSRGAQVVHRFTQWYPERVEAVALFSAGSYTLPYAAMSAAGASQNMALPFGIADMQAYTGRGFDVDAFRKVRFFVGVGGADANPGDVPRAWDATLGTTRVTRAQAFADALRGMRMDTVFAVFPGVGHEVTPEMRAAAMAFLEQAPAS